MSISEPSGISRATGRQPKIWGKVPQRNKNFTGREDLLDKLHTGVTAEVTAVVPHALHGFGGVGKTHVAIEYAYRFRHEYDLVWWIPADQPILVRSSLAALAPHLGVSSSVTMGVEEASRAVLDALRRGEPYSRWLLVFDNAEQPEDVNDIIPRGPGHVLITSRSHAWQSVVDTVPVDVFSRAESIDFLSKRVPRSTSLDDRNLLAEQLGDLPLALEQAGALQTETGMSVGQYLRLLDEQTVQLLDANKASDYPLSMTAAWSLSVSQLKAKLPEAVEVLRCCAFFGPDPIPRDVFGVLPEEFAQGSRLGPLLADPILLSKAIRELGRYALVRIDSENRTIQVHRLVQALLRDELRDEEHVSFRREVHLLLVAATPGLPDDNGSWPRYAELLGHMRPALVEESGDPRVRGFALDVVRYLYSSGGYQSAVELVESFIRRWRADSGEDDQNVLSARRHLGIVLRELGDYRASFELNRDTLARMQVTLGPEHEETLLLVNSHGADMRMRGDFADALEHDKESFGRHQAVFGPDHRRTLRAMNNLSVDYMLLGDYPQAFELQKVLYTKQRSSDSTSSSLVLLAARNGLARIVRLRGDYSEACDLGEDAYEFGVQELGPDHPWTLRVAKDLSIAKRRAGLIDEAFEIAERTYERENRIFGRDHHDTLAAALCLANAQRTRGEITEALELLRDTAARYPERYGDEHPFTFGCDMNLALLLRVNGEIEEASRLDRRSLEGLDRTLGRGHHYSLTCAINLASDFAAMGDTPAARQLGQETLTQLRELLGVDHPLTLACANNLVVDMRAEGDTEEAGTLEADTFERYQRVLGNDHPDTKVALRGERLDFDFDPPAL
ncbi:FxSxx-COOH system tetratricopeptide repeat protein [Streptosporangium sp. NBC_01755]|uniref:FxSxx-COOH system tetratricopeptide repeat protein n=1 Tax=unclassified Streptosporangium TaxID=2632669 RepID=UPI002DD9D4CA|nr:MULTISPECIES: FxSxx-COOH system tetratricopeptide repeat protein [unclassified Streptosporangium]WSA27788.1 FxSxx-COOH system tetratricopeptide repeat protein [Streptosporangium sp. NBC_01810]WSD00737.1 FxSxx-COOH system tetratricopeptide repeat protein [Streptosporangium sp. NBC_01755]